MSLLRQILLDSPLVCYPVDEASGTTVKNLGSLGSAYNATCAGTHTRGNRDLIPGLPKSTDFATGYASTPSLPVSGYSAITMKAWFINDVLNGSGSAYISDVFGRELDVATNTMLLRGFGNDGTSTTQQACLFGIATTGGTTYAISANGIMQLNTRYHMVGTWESGVAPAVWINGVQLVTTTSGGTPSGTTHANTAAGPHRIAGSVTYGRPLDGTVGYCAIYPSKLSADRIKAHYQAGLRSGVVVG